jgi:thiol-disulfide isomerase/thioredoxin
MARMMSWNMALVFWFVAQSGSANDLDVGAPAPKLDVKQFIKGEPVKSFEKGRSYVVEFWATWCGPCRATIPHLTELQKKHRDVTFIGVSVWEHDPKAVRPFVEGMKDKMDYRVAMDLVPEGAKVGQMAKSWMDAACQDGIPTAFIINGDGNIAWIGHPVELEKPLEQVVNNQWDLQAAAKTFKKEVAEKRKLREVMAKVDKARATGDSAGVLAILNEAIAGDAKLESRLGQMKFDSLDSGASSRDEAWSYGRHLVEDVWKDKAHMLNIFAWQIVDPDTKRKPEARLVQLALQAAQRADELTKGKDAGILDTLARAHFLTGDGAKALELQQRAVDLAKGTGLEKDLTLKERLEAYSKAAKKNAAPPKT